MISTPKSLPISWKPTVSCLTEVRLIDWLSTMRHFMETGNSQMALISALMVLVAL
jgi:hypothetical protein